MRKMDSTATSRNCTICGEHKDLSDFGSAKSGALGKNSACKTCTRARDKAKRDGDKDALTAMDAMADMLKAKNKQERILLSEKNCTWCKTVKPASEFAKAPDRVDGLRGYCKECSNARNRQHRKDNPDAVYRYDRKYALRIKQDPIVRIHKSFSRRVWRMLNGMKSGRRTIDIIGYDTELLRSHLEKQFTDGMTWGNYGEWHVDHIMPIASFKGISDKEIRAAWCLSNLRPLWKEENIRKKDKILFLV